MTPEDAVSLSTAPLELAVTSMHPEQHWHLRCCQEFVSEQISHGLHLH